MGLLRLLIIAALLFAAVALIRRYLLASTRRGQGRSPAEEMVRCAQCGLYLPARSSLEKEGQRFCCQEHRDGYRG